MALVVEWISVFQYRSGLVKILLKLYCNPVRNFRVDFTYMRRSGAADLPLHLWICALMAGINES